MSWFMVSSKISYGFFIKIVFVIYMYYEQEIKFLVSSEVQYIVRS